MATISKTPDGTYRVKIRKQGYPTVSRNFNKKTLAQRWALQVNHCGKGHSSTWS